MRKKIIVSMQRLISIYAKSASMECKIFLYSKFLFVWGISSCLH